MSSFNPYGVSEAGTSEQVSPKVKRSVVFAWIAVAIACVTAIAIFVSQRSFARMFEEFEIKLPVVTLIACSPVLPLGLLSIALVAVVVSLSTQHARIAHRWSVLSILSSIFTLTIYVCGVFSPLMHLISDLSK